MKYKIEIGSWSTGTEPEYEGVSFSGTLDECHAFIKLCMESGFEGFDWVFSPNEINHIKLEAI